MELGLVFFYLWYVLEFYYRLYQYKNPHLAYINICFEREAYANESNLHYLKERFLGIFKIQIMSKVEIPIIKIPHPNKQIELYIKRGFGA